MDKSLKYNMKKEKIASLSKLVIPSVVVSSLLIIVLSISNLPTQIFGQKDTINNDNQLKQSIRHNAVGHETHQVVQFVESKDNTIFDGSITFKSSIPVDIIVYNYTSIVADNTNNTNIKPWKIEKKTFIPTTIMKNLHPEQLILKDLVLLHIFYIIKHMMLHIL